ncbi:FSR family fosmidomycin resistance protein-like MFS transporter [Parabacteroides sp. PFB2-10]|uniref:MFS transporter n=1 Tax=Parabacteroides sp. PFB2-10 TaxID=1742405 RepID=UPI0024733E34|nr:MFS transporter [Parabacteroides sp. PFB2-10]MDH6313766.1 FSR family fosmidomycin resistance protein-like MFS transporter [Parabacteroides sp. PFB2-10]
MKSKAVVERAAPSYPQTYLKVLLALSLTHLTNDMLQSVVSASYPVIRDNLALTFGQIGLIAFVYQVCASVFQPVFGVLFDKKPRTWYLTLAIISTATGLVILAVAHSIFAVILAVAFVGLGSSITHPEASRLTHYASGGRHGLAQSIFQVGGNFGSAIGPLLAALIIAPYGQEYMLVFAAIAVFSILTKRPISKWNRRRITDMQSKTVSKTVIHRVRLRKKQIYYSLGILLILIFSKYVYTASLSNYYTFYLIEKFDVTTQHSQLFLFAYLFASALGTFIGGPVGDRFGRKYVIWFSILGTAPFSLMMPYANLFWTCVLSIIIGFVLSSAFSAILVYAQELLPTKVGLISGLFFGLAFGIAGIAAAVLGYVADHQGIEAIYRFCAYMPLLGFVAIFLPNIKPQRIKKG